MKTLIVLSAVFLPMLGLKAQLNKGTKNVSAFLSLSTNNRSDKDSSNGRIEDNKSIVTSNFFNYGYFVKDNLLAGVRVGYRNTNNNGKVKHVNSNWSFEYKSKNISSSYSIGFFMKQYKTFYKERFAFFMLAAVDGRYGNSTFDNTVMENGITTNTNRKNTEVGASLSFRPGFAYFVTNRVALEALAGGAFSVNYSTNKTFNKGKQTGTNSGFSSSLNFNPFGISLGFNFFFGAATRQ